VREDDAEPEVLEDEDHALEEGAVVAMAVKEEPLLWRTFPEEYVESSEGGTVVTEINYAREFVQVATGVELTEGRHYWKVELLSKTTGGIYVGVARPNLDPEGDYALADCTDAWFISAPGFFWGNGKGGGDNEVCYGKYEQGDLVGVLLDLNNGLLLFFKNGVQHGPGYPAGSAKGPVVPAAELCDAGHALRLHAPSAAHAMRLNLDHGGVEE
jgi:hypothetical protein